MTKSVHDPLYGFMEMTDVELQVIDSPAFRRLHRLRQLSQAYMVYPSAHHTRFEHSLGVCHLAGRVAAKLGMDPDAVQTVRLAGLLHDIGHGPFSHLFEPVMGMANAEYGGHESVSRMIIRRDADISGILGNYAPRISAILGHDPVPGWDVPNSMLAADMISGPLDVDRMDYLRRDSYHLGVSYGRFDLDQLIHNISFTPGDQRRLCIDMKGWAAAEGYRLSRFLMHAQVYQHHTIMVANHMLLAALEMALDEGALDCEALDVKSPDFICSYMELDDQRLVDMILSRGRESGRMIERLRRRDLLKRIYQIYPDREVPNAAARLQLTRLDTAQQKQMARDMSDTLGLGRHDIMVHSSHIPVKHKEGQILVSWKGIPKSFDSYTPIISSHSPIDKLYVFGPDNDAVRAGVAKYMRERFCLPG